MARLFLKWLARHILILGNTGKSFRSINYNEEFVVSYLQVALLNRAMNKHLAENQVAAVRYIVNDVDSAVSFYSSKLGFDVDLHIKSKFASLSLGDLQLYINSPGAGGAGQSMPDGTLPTPGGWNRFQLQVKNIESTVEDLKKSGVKFRNEIVTGVGGKQILLEDPAGEFYRIVSASIVMSDFISWPRKSYH